MTIQIETLLRDAGLLRDMDPRATDALLGRIAVQTYEAGAFLISEGEIGDAAYVLLAGSLQVLGTRPDGGWIALSRLEPGALFGEQALLGRAGGRRAATVRAITPVTVARLGAQEFQDALPPNHSIRRRLVRLGEEQLRERLAKQSSIFMALFPSSEGDASGGLGAELCTFERGKALFYQGQPAEDVYLIVSGVAGLYVEKGGGPQLVARAEAGRCLGERGLLHRVPHAITAIAEEMVTAFRVPGERFLELHAKSPELREHLASLESIYQLPRRGFVTQFAGTFQDRECLTSVYHLPGGRRAVASHVPLENLTHLIVYADGASSGEPRVYRYEDPSLEIEREIGVSASGSVVSLTARGEWTELPEIFVLALDAGALTPWQCDAFSETGSIALERQPNFHADDEIICACMRVLRGEVRKVILEGCTTEGAIRDRCKAGGACGACKPRLREMLGKSAWTPARVASVVNVASGVRAFRLVPRRGEVRPAKPGQHIVIQAQIDGRWVERPYTLSAPTSEGYYEVTIKRIPGGVFSSWFFDGRARDALIQVSDPQGEFCLAPDNSPAVFFVAGIGVTPAIAACRALKGSAEPRSVMIDYSATKPELAAYAAEIEGAPADCPGMRTRVRFTRQSGRIGQLEIAAVVDQNPGATYFLCGPASYIASVRSVLIAKGVLSRHVRTEEFVSAGENAPPPSLALSLRAIQQSPASLRMPGAPYSLRPPPSKSEPLSSPFSVHASGAAGSASPPSVSPMSEVPRSDGGRITWIPSTTRAGHEPRSQGLPALESGGVCPYVHGTHRDDGIGVVPPITAGAEASVAEQARAFLVQMYREKGAPKTFAARWRQVSREIEQTGTYTHTYDELSFGAKLAWRNSTRCIGRLFWSGLQVRDLRHLTREEDMLSAMLEHIELATNGGNLRALMTVFAPAGRDGRGPRIWNGQLLRYAGYRRPDGGVTGDPMNADLTEHALKLGWRPAQRTRFDVLPLIMSLPGKDPKWMEIPRGLVREVQITHPDHPFFLDMGLKWYALPAVSELLLDVGGIKYTAAPFNGWYMDTEIGARNFSDLHRYNLLPEVAERLGLDMRSPSTLWKDRAQIELARAVIHSFDRAGVKLSNHHAAADDFLQFIDAEEASGRCVHMRWSWITPPIAGSATAVFHVDEEKHPDISLKPNFFYQPRPYSPLHSLPVP